MLYLSIYLSIGHAFLYLAIYLSIYPPQRRIGTGVGARARPSEKVAAMASASPPSGKAAPLPEVQEEEEEEATRRQIEHWRSELSNLGAERSRLQRWRAGQVRTAAASTLP